MLASGKETGETGGKSGFPIGTTDVFEGSKPGHHTIDRLRETEERYGKRRGSMTSQTALRAPERRGAIQILIIIIIIDRTIVSQTSISVKTHFRSNIMSSSRGRGGAERIWTFPNAQMPL